MKKQYKFITTVLDQSRHQVGFSVFYKEHYTELSRVMPDYVFDISHSSFHTFFQLCFIAYEKIARQNRKLANQFSEYLTAYLVEVFSQLYAFPWERALSWQALVEVYTWIDEQYENVLIAYEVEVSAIKTAIEFGEFHSLTDGKYWRPWFLSKLRLLCKSISINILDESQRLDMNIEIDKARDNDLIHEIRRQMVNCNFSPYSSMFNLVDEMFQSDEDINPQSLRAIFDTKISNQNIAYQKILQQKRQQDRDAKISKDSIKRIYQKKKQKAFKAFTDLIVPFIKKVENTAINIGASSLGTLIENHISNRFIDQIFLWLLEHSTNDILEDIQTRNNNLKKILFSKETNKELPENSISNFLIKDPEKILVRVLSRVKGICSSANEATAKLRLGKSIDDYLDNHWLMIQNSEELRKFLGFGLRVYLPLFARQRHTFILGKSGSGKTELIKKMVYEDIQQNRGVFILDPHGDLAKECLRFKLFEKNTNIRERLVYISSDFISEGSAPQYNPLDYIPKGKTKFERHNDISVRAMELSISFELIFGTEFTPNMKLMLTNCITLLLQVDNVHLGNLVEMLYPDGNGVKPYNHVLKSCDDGLKQYFSYIFPAKRLDLAKTAIITRFSEATSNQFFKNMLYAKKSSFNFSELLDDGKIIIVDANQGRLSRQGTKILGALLTAEMVIMALSRANRRAEDRKPVFVYIDECQNFLSSSIDKILAEGRKYGVHLTLANQFLGQFDGNSRIRQSILANTAVKLCGSSSAKDQTALSGELRFDFKDGVKLGKGRFICSVDGAQGIVFQASSDLLPPIDDNRYYSDSGYTDTIIKEQLNKYYQSIYPQEDKIDSPSRELKLNMENESIEDTSETIEYPTNGFNPEIDEL